MKVAKSLKYEKLILGGITKSRTNLMQIFKWYNVCKVLSSLARTAFLNLFYKTLAKTCNSPYDVAIGLSADFIFYISSLSSLQSNHVHLTHCLISVFLKYVLSLFNGNITCVNFFNLELELILKTAFEKQPEFRY